MKGRWRRFGWLFCLGFLLAFPLMYLLSFGPAYQYCGCSVGLAHNIRPHSQPELRMSAVLSFAAPSPTLARWYAPLIRYMIDHQEDRNKVVEGYLKYIHWWNQTPMSFRRPTGHLIRTSFSRS